MAERTTRHAPRNTVSYALKCTPPRSRYSWPLVNTILRMRAFRRKMAFNGGSAGLNGFRELFDLCCPLSMRDNIFRTNRRSRGRLRVDKTLKVGKIHRYNNIRKCKNHKLFLHLLQTSLSHKPYTFIFAWNSFIFPCRVPSASRIFVGHFLHK